MLPDIDDGMGWVQWLSRQHDAELATLAELNDLYEGTAPLHYIHPEILREVGDRLQAVALGWPMIAVDPLWERLQLDGFRYSDDGDAVTERPDEELDASALGADENLRRVWANNDMANEFSMAMCDALVMRRAFLCVGTNEADRDSPLVTAESPLEMWAYIDPRTRLPLAGLRRWSEYDESAARLPQQYATLYQANRTVWYDRGPTGWREIGRDNHMLGTPPIALMANRGRLAGRYGQSELTAPLLSLSHAANKIASDMMVAGEFHALPLRAIFGIGPEDLVDEQGNRVSALQAIMGRLLTVPTDSAGDVKPFEWSPSTLSNFHDTLNQLARMGAGLLGLDAHEFGFTSDNPASAEALRARESRLIRRAERKQTAFTSAACRTARLIRRFQENDVDPRANRLEAIWRDPATPTRSSAADAAVKMFSTSPPIVPLRQTREDLGYSAGQIRRMEAEDAKARALDPLAEVARGLADRPMPMPADA